MLCSAGDEGESQPFGGGVILEPGIKLAGSRGTVGEVGVDADDDDARRGL